MTRVSLSRVDEETIAHDEWVRLCCQEEKGTVWSVALSDRVQNGDDAEFINKSNVVWHVGQHGHIKVSNCCEHQ